MRLDLGFAGVGLALLVPSVWLCRRPFSAPVSPRGRAALDPPVAAEADPSNVYRTPTGAEGCSLPEPSAFFRSLRHQEIAARFAVAGVLAGLLDAPVFAWAQGDPYTAFPFVLLHANVLLAVLAASVWQQPAARRRREFVATLVSERGVASDAIVDAPCVDVWAHAGSNGSGTTIDDVGFVGVEGGRLLLRTDSRDLRIDRSQVDGVARCRLRGATMSVLFGVRAVALRWRPEPAGPAVWLYLLARDGESAFTIKRRNDALAARIVDWRTEPSTVPVRA
ncbi:MAG: hypothetical protein U0610_16030 [bacterium]